MDGALLNMSCFCLPVCLLVVATPFSGHVDNTMLQLVLAQVQHAGILRNSGKSYGCPQLFIVYGVYIIRQ